MKTKFWLTINSNGTPKAQRTQPRKLQANEITMMVALELPSKLFERPQLQASISVPESAVSPTVITAQVADNIKESVKAATGLDLKITVSAAEEKAEKEQ